MAEVFPCGAIRFRRDFSRVLALPSIHAVLNQHARGRTEDGRIIATIEDYRATRELLEPTIGRTLGTSIPVGVHDLVELAKKNVKVYDNKYQVPWEVSLREIGKEMGGISHTTVSRRLAQAVSLGLLNSNKFRETSAHQITLGIQEEGGESIPTVEAVEKRLRERKEQGL